MAKIAVRDRRDGFLWINNRILDDYGTELGGVALLVYMYLSRYASNETSECWPSQEFLAKRCGVGERQIKRAIKSLTAFNLISVERRKVYDESHPQNVYTLLNVPKSGDKNVPSPAESGDIDPPESGDTTAPLLRLIEQDLKPSPLNAEQISNVECFEKLSEKTKHRLFKESIFKCYRYLNEEDPPWDGSDAKQLSAIIKSKPDLTPEKFHQWLGHYSKSLNINPSDRPRKFLPNIFSYAGGPLGEFGKPLDESKRKSVYAS